MRQNRNTFYTIDNCLVCCKPLDKAKGELDNYQWYEFTIQEPTEKGINVNKQRLLGTKDSIYETAKILVKIAKIDLTNV